MANIAELTFRTTDATRWGLGKNAPLTSNEGDTNIWSLADRLSVLENNPPMPTDISNIVVIGNQMIVYLSNGGSFGPFILPTAILRFRGDFVGGRSYMQLDIIRVPKQGLFLVNSDHVAGPTFDPNATDASSNALYQMLFGDDSGYIYDIGFFYPGQVGLGIEDGGAMLAHNIIRPVQLPADLAGSKATLTTAPAFALSVDIMKNDVKIGSIDFAQNAMIGTFTFAADVNFAIGDRIRVKRPVAFDPSARELSVTFLGIRI
jgi:hypothetical protein